MFVDPDVVRRKVDRELSEFVELIDHYRSRGIWLLEYRFPTILFAMIARGAKPYALVAFGIRMDVSNYDVEPPSVVFVNPITQEPLKASEIPVRVVATTPDGKTALMLLPRLRSDGTVEALVQADADANPFVCLQGVREYHQHAAHSGDHWLLHRGTGIGRIAWLMDVLARHSTDIVGGIEFNIQIGGLHLVQLPAAA